MTNLFKTGVVKGAVEAAARQGFIIWWSSVALELICSLAMSERNGWSLRDGNWHKRNFGSSRARLDHALRGDGGQVELKWIGEGLMDGSRMLDWSAWHFCGSGV